MKDNVLKGWWGILRNRAIFSLFGMFMLGELMDMILTRLNVVYWLAGLILGAVGMMIAHIVAECVILKYRS